MLAKPIIQPTPSPAIVRPVPVQRGGATPHYAIDAVREIEGVMARAAQGHDVHGGRDAAPRATANVIVLETGADASAPRPGAVSGRASSAFLAQQIAQETDAERNTGPASPLSAYAEAAARGTIFFGLEYPLDISI